MRVLDLFSCVGAHALGLHGAGGFTTVQFVEWDAWRRRVLECRFPGIPVHDDVRTFTGARGSADIIVGGPPCQNTSLASAIWGHRTGATLWPDMLRIIQEVEPSWVVVEQPPGNKAWEAQVMGDMEAVGFHHLRLEFAASDLGAPHIRRRVFLLAHRSLSRLEVTREKGPGVLREVSAHHRNPWHEGVPRTVRMDAGASGGMDRRRRIEAIGDSNPPIMMTVIGRLIQES